jgi:hypothetical protein
VCYQVRAALGGFQRNLIAKQLPHGYPCQSGFVGVTAQAFRDLIPVLLGRAGQGVHYLLVAFGFRL